MGILHWVAIFFMCIALANARTECLSVRGHVKCGGGRLGSGAGGRGQDDFGSGRGRNTPPVFLKLIDEDTGGPDDWMDEGYASKTGAFQLYGCASDGLLGGSIEPFLRIYHKCKGSGKRFTIEIPVAQIGKEYNLTTVYDLSGPLQNEKDDTYPVPTCSSQRPASFYFFKR